MAQIRVCVFSNKVSECTNLRNALANTWLIEKGKQNGWTDTRGQLFGTQSSP